MSSSLALRDIPIPDYCDVVIVPTRGVQVRDPQIWAEAIFAHENASLAMRGTRALFDEALRMVDIVPSPRGELVTDEVRGNEALIVDDNAHRMLRIAVEVDENAPLLKVTTAIKFRTLRGRLAFIPRKLTHAAFVNTLARRAPVTVRRRLVNGTQRANTLPGRTVAPARQIEKRGEG
ncbi:hypothetical protein ACUH90_00155 [Dermabacteraceae bacterium P7054]